MSTKETEGTLATTSKIKAAAHQLFLQKGFASTTIRDIAQLAGTNVALLNYYFSSKKNLFEVVMLEKIQQLFSKLVPIFSNEHTSIREKVTDIAETYIDFLSHDPDLLTFILNEIRKNNFEFITKTHAVKLIYQSHFMQQLKETYNTTNPIHFLLNMVSMIVFPFVAKPAITQTGLAEDSEFKQLMQERKKLIPVWVDAMLNANQNIQ